MAPFFTDPNSPIPARGVVGLQELGGKADSARLFSANRKLHLLMLTGVSAGGGGFGHGLVFPMSGRGA